MEDGGYSRFMNQISDTRSRGPDSAIAPTRRFYPWLVNIAGLQIHNVVFIQSAILYHSKIGTWEEYRRPMKMIYMSKQN